LWGGPLYPYADRVGGQDVVVYETQILRQTNRQAVGFVAYPFNRAQRVEFQAGVQHLSLDFWRQKIALTLDGRVVYDSTGTQSLGRDLTLGVASAAFVYDNSVFGATSPIIGQRYRLEASPVVGTLFFTTALADYRRYVMPLRPFTLAGRVIHVGRYGPDANDPNIAQLALWYPSLVRGYDYGSLDSRECSSPACPEFQQLRGSKLLVANAELRFPFFGVLGLGDGYYGFLPIEAALFYDAGVAWTDTEGAKLWGNGPRNVVTSAGVSFRMNLFGFAIGQLDYVRPFARPTKDWMIRLSLTPGF
jgi:outer membrane protein assembly factor BamA